MSAVAIVLVALAIAATSPRPRLVDVVRSGDEGRALRMLGEGADPNQRDARGLTPLMWAAALGQIELATWLLDRGAALNAEIGGSDYSGPADTALSFAAANGNTAMVDFLLSRGAVPDRFNTWSRLPDPYPGKLRKIGDWVSSAAQYVNPSGTDLAQIDKFLRASPTGAYKAALNEMLWLAAAQGSDDVVDKLLKLGASPLADFRATMALEIALRSAGAHSPQRVRTALRLLKAGQPVSVVRRAVRNELDKDAPPELLAALGDLPGKNSALADAVRRGDVQEIRAWLARGADPLASDATGRRLTDLALESRQADVIAAFTDAGAVDVPVDPRTLLLRIRAATANLNSDAGRRIVRAVDWYLGRSSSDASAEYLRGFEAMASLLEQQPDEATVNDIADDLDSKREFCLRNNVGMGGSVTVDVHTQNAAGEVSKWQVYYLLKIYEHAPNVPAGAFRRWSSPASEMLGPGRYLIWAQDPFTRKTSEKKLVELKGAPNVVVDLPVP